MKRHEIGLKRISQIILMGGERVIFYLSRFILGLRGAIIFACPCPKMSRVASPRPFLIQKIVRTACLGPVLVPSRRVFNYQGSIGPLIYTLFFPLGPYVDLSLNRVFLQLLLYSSIFY